MKRIDFRIIIGSLMILAGLIGLLDHLGIFPAGLEAMDIFWGILTFIGGAAFLYIFFTNREQWWTAFPGFVLLGISATALLPNSLSAWDGMAFMTGLSLAFWAVYITGRERWWAIIPAGVLLTLGTIALITSLFEGVDVSGLFMIGLGLTFLLVAILPPVGRSWAFIPAAVLIIFGVVLGTPFSEVLDYIWIAALFLGGLALIWYYIRNK